MKSRDLATRMSMASAAIVVILVAMFAAVGCGGDSGGAATPPDQSAEQGTLLVATAASLKAAFTEIGEAFDQANGSKTAFTFDASGALQKQIEGGAPVDVFVSAAQVQVDNLLEKDLVDEASIATFATNEIVLAVPAESTLPMADFADLTLAEVKTITTADPVTAPQGKTALEVLEHLDLLDEVESKFVYAKNAPQTLTYVIQGEVDAGLMFATDAINAGDAVRVIAVAEPSWHSEIAYVTALVSDSKAKTLGQAFLDFVTGAEGRAILDRHGFILP